MDRTGRAILTGRALVRGLPGLQQVRHLTGSSMMDVDFLPEHPAIVGGSYIGLEFAQICQRFGSRVAVAEMGGAWPRRAGAARSGAS